MEISLKHFCYRRCCFCFVFLLFWIKKNSRSFWRRARFLPWIKKMKKKLSATVGGEGRRPLASPPGLEQTAASRTHSRLQCLLTRPPLLHHHPSHPPLHHSPPPPLTWTGVEWRQTQPHSVDTHARARAHSMSNAWATRLIVQTNKEIFCKKAILFPPLLLFPLMVVILLGGDGCFSSSPSFFSHRMTIKCCDSLPVLWFFFSVYLYLDVFKCHLTAVVSRGHL